MFFAANLSGVDVLRNQGLHHRAEHTAGPQVREGQEGSQVAVAVWPLPHTNEISQQRNDNVCEWQIWLLFHFDLKILQKNFSYNLL